MYIDIRFKSDGVPIVLSQKQQVETTYGMVLWPTEDGANASKVSDTVWTTSFEMRALQPKREVAQPVRLYISAERDCTVEVDASIYADTLAEPIQRRLTIEYKIKTVDSSFKNLLEELEEQDN